MAIRIESITPDGVLDKRCLLYNAHIARKLSFGNEWTRLRIAMRCAWGDFADTLQTSYMFFGLMSNPASPLTNGPLSTDSESHFLGLSSRRDANVSSWIRSTLSGLPFYGPINLSYVQLHNGIFTDEGSAVQTNFSAGLATPTRQVLVIEYTKVLGGTIEINVVKPNPAGLTYIRDLPTKEALWGGMEIDDATLADVEAWFEDQSTNGTGDTYGRNTGLSLSVDEGLYGPLNAITVGWNRSIVPMGVSDIAYCRFS